MHLIIFDRQTGAEHSSYSQAIEVANDPEYKAIERAIHNYKHKKALAEKKVQKMSSAVLLGFMRGAIIGIILGGDAGVIEGMVSFGSLNGILHWISERLVA